MHQCLVYSLINFDMYIQSRDRTFSPPQKGLSHLFATSSSIPIPDNHRSTFYHNSFISLESQKIIQCVPGFFHSTNDFEIRSCFCMYQYSFFLMMRMLLLCGCSTVCLFILLLMNIWVVSSLGLL